MGDEDPRELPRDETKDQEPPQAREADEDARWDSQDDGDYRYTDWASI